MSILIRGIEMPKNCAFCPVEHYDCPLLGEDEKGWGIDVTAYFDGNERHPDCPLIELPPHGRLIDADALTDAIELIDWYHQNKNKDMVEGANSDEEQAWYREQDIYAAIDDAPTIIESEGEDG